MRMLARTGLLAVLVSLALPAVAAAAPATWEEGAPVPLGRIRYGHTQCATDPGRFYVISGLDRTVNATITTERFDTGSGTWEELAPVPEPSQGPTAVCVGDRIHLFGGANRFGEPTTNHFVYDVAASKWSTAAPVPRPVWGAAAGGLGGRIYLIGGDDDFLPDRVSDEVTVYDVASDTWVGTAAPMPTGAVAAGSVQAGRYVYLAGGWDASAPDSHVPTTQRFDLLTATWSTGPDLPGAPADFALAASGGTLYAIGGDAEGGSFRDATATVRHLNLVAWPAGAWVTEPDPLPIPLLANSGGFAAGKRIWTVGGASGQAGITDLTLSKPFVAGRS